MTRLSTQPLIHATARVSDSRIGRYTEIGERCSVCETVLDDYSYMMRECEIWAAVIGKFANIASHVRVNATNHPVWRASQHHFTYRAGDYFEDAGNEAGFFDWRRDHPVTIGHDVWIGHGAIILPGVCVGNGAVVGAGAVVSRNVDPYTVVAGVPARPVRERFPAGIGNAMDELAWWDWPHERLRSALDDFRRLSAAEFLARHASR